MYRSMMPITSSPCSTILPALQPDHAVAGFLDLFEVMRDQEYGAGLVPQFIDPGVALDPELGVAGGQSLVDQQDS